MNTCPKCGRDTELSFCPSCGKIIKYPTFISDNDKLKQDLDDYVKNLVSVAQSCKKEIYELVSNGKLADAAFRQYYEHVAYLQSLCSQPEIASYFDKDGASLFDIMRGFANKCARNECQIAVVGTVKAGKSMFLNAILGKEIASSYPTPETASLTKFRYSEKGDYVKITYYTPKEWEELWESVQKAKDRLLARDNKEDFITTYIDLGAEHIKDEYLGKVPEVFDNLSFDELKRTVERYTSAKHPEHFFAKEVEVGLSEFNVPKNVVFVDTPGLNDQVEFRSNITRKYISSANVVLLCIKADGATITASELNDIATLFSEMRYAKDRIYIFGTQYDLRDDFQSYWTDFTRKEFVKHLSGKSYFGDVAVAEQRIVPVSAYYFNMMQRAKNNQQIWDDKTERTKLAIMVTKCLGFDFSGISPMTRFYDSIEQLEEITNVHRVRQIILDGPVKEAENIIVNDIAKAYKGICCEVIEAADITISMNDDLVLQSEGNQVYQKIAEAEAKIARLKENHQKNLKLIADVLSSIENETEKMLEQVK